MGSERYGLLTVLAEWGRVTINKKNHTRLAKLCACDCGTFIVVESIKLTNGNTTSCGCKRKTSLLEINTKHGMSRSHTYKCWADMKSRCANVKNKSYSEYGGRGISVSEDWLTFDNFLKDMGISPDGYSIERIDVNGNYCKENCIWENDLIQAQNKRIRKSNRSGVTGVNLHSKGKLWVAHISFNHESKTSYHKTFEEACTKRREYEEEREEMIEKYKRDRLEVNP